MELYRPEEGYTVAAELVSDSNGFPGIDFVVYGEDTRQMRRRVQLEGCSILEQIEQAQMLFLEQYQYETVQGMERIIVQEIPLDAFRELLVNALVHREWQIQARIKVECFKEGIRITSPGGLPEGTTEEDYFSDRHLSILRNKTLGLLFFKLGLMENLGTGLPFVQDLYRTSWEKPTFTFLENTITAFLPLMTEKPDLTGEQEKVLRIIKVWEPVSSAQTTEQSGLSAGQIKRILKELVDLKLVRMTGKARATRYEMNR